VKVWYIPNEKNWKCRIIFQITQSCLGLKVRVDEHKPSGDKDYTIVDCYWIPRKVLGKYGFDIFAHPGDIWDRRRGKTYGEWANQIYHMERRNCRALNHNTRFD
jgi:hypothetical protein